MTLHQENKQIKKIVICPGASVKWKSWNLENFIEMANYLIQKMILFLFLSKRKKLRT